MKTSIALGFALITLLSLAGCAEFPLVGGPRIVPQPVSPEESLIVIMTETKNPDSLPEGRAYDFILSGGYPHVYVTSRFCAFKVSEPGVLINAVTTHVAAEFTGDDNKVEINLPLPYEAGKLVVYDYVFVLSYKKIDSSRFSTSWNFRLATSDERAKLIESLKVSEDYARWM